MPIALAVLLAAAAQGPAQQPAPAASAAPRQPPATIVAEPAAMFIAACDADGDARVTRAELSACIARSFVGDPAQGGSIGYIGYSDWALKWLGDRNALPSPFGIDRDQDNRITLAELQAEFAAIFARLDLDRDGMLTRAELLTIRAAAVGEPGTGKGGKHGGREPR